MSNLHHWIIKILHHPSAVSVVDIRNYRDNFFNSGFHYILLTKISCSISYTLPCSVLYLYVIKICTHHPFTFSRIIKNKANIIQKR